jgi:hypothetical protein
MGVLLLPFVALWRLVALVIELTGRLIGVTLGAVLVMVGVLLCLTVVGLVLGLPLVALGAALIVRGLF